MTTADNDKHVPILSNQALAAYFLNRTDNVQFEETAEAFILRIPKRSFAQQLTDSGGEGNFGSLYEAIKHLPKADYGDDAVNIQRQMRDEWL